MSLTGKQKRHLRGLAHPLGPVAQVGQKGVTEELTAKVSEELEHHELIKVKCGQGSWEEPKVIGAALAEACEAELVQVIGGVIVLYKERKKDPEIRLPKR